MTRSEYITMKSEFPIVWVHLGTNRVPNYLRKSLKSHARMFPHRTLILLVDDKRNKFSFGAQNLKVVDISTEASKWDFFRELLEHDLTFRNAFWFTSMARFIAIEKFLNISGYDKALHVESDTVLMPNFPFTKFHEIGEKIAFCIQGEGQGIASIFYLGSRRNLVDFLDSMAQQVRRNSKSTDMTSLYGFYLEHPKKVLILPSTTSMYGLEDTNVESKRAIGRNLDLFGGIFDPISIGQFLFGIDPRNERGLRVLFREHTEHFLRPSKLTFSIKDNLLFLSDAEGNMPIFSLHIHSKDSRIFDHDSLLNHLKKRLAQAGQGERVEWVPQVWLNLVIAAMIRRLKRRLLCDK